MVIIRAGDASRAAYRRLWVLESIQGLLYEAPNRSRIEARLADLVSGPINMQQLENILNQLEQAGLATFERTGQGYFGWGTWSEKLFIIDLDERKLKDLLKSTRQDTKGDEYEPDISEEPRKTRSDGKFYHEHPWLSGIILALISLILSAIFLS